MKATRILCLAVLLFLSTNTFAQSLREKFLALCASNDIAGQTSVLKEWEAKSPDDPELYVAYFNHYVQKSITEVLTMDATSNDTESLQLTDSSGTTAGFINSEIKINEDDLKKGIEYINNGINKFPDRLDMRFGKIYALGQFGMYDDFTSEIIKTIEYSNNNKNRWRWSENALREDGKEMMLESIQDYVMQLYETNDDALLENMKQISETVLKYYPDHVQSLSNISVVHLLRNEIDAGLVSLLKAEKVAPTDHIILGNIAQAYKMKGDKKNSLKYYELMFKHGDDGAKSDAKQQIQKLKAK